MNDMKKFDEVYSDDLIWLSNKALNYYGILLDQYWTEGSEYVKRNSITPELLKQMREVYIAERNRAKAIQAKLFSR